MTIFHIVLLEGNDEGVLFTDHTDALIAAGTVEAHGFHYSSFADEFSDMYEDKKRSISQVNIDIGDTSNGWRPIETAPKDETLILVAAYDGDGGYHTECYCGVNLAKTRNKELYYSTPFELTHWMPIPEAPQKDIDHE
jgi:hypothetical protein